MIAALSALMMALHILDAASTQWKRARRGDRIELNPVMRWIMAVFGDYWVAVRALGGLGLWAFIVPLRGWPLTLLGLPPIGDTLAAVLLSLVSAGLFVVVWWNSRSRFGLWWPRL
jgi:hypothetical protein